MLDPRAYRAALLEELTSSAVTTPLHADNDKSGVVSRQQTRRQPQGGSDAFNEDVSTSLSSSPALRLSEKARSSTVSRDTQKPPPFTRPDACVIEDSVVRQGASASSSTTSFRSGALVPRKVEMDGALQQQQQPRNVAGYGYLVEKESNRSLILSFIDNCIRAGVPESTIAEQVQFMVSSMQESLALHAALHAQRQKARVREYELGELTNMLERQQLQFTQQQQQQHQRERMVSSVEQAPQLLADTRFRYADPVPQTQQQQQQQLAPPPPLVYVSSFPALHTPLSIHTRNSVHDNSTLRTSYGTPSTETKGRQPASPQRRAPSPPLGDSPLALHGERRNVTRDDINSAAKKSFALASTWRQQRQEQVAAQPIHEQKPSAQLRYGQQKPRQVTSSGGEDGIVTQTKAKGASSTRSRTRSPSPHINEKAGVATTHAAHSLHRGHHALCDVCQRNAATEAGGEAAEVPGGAAAATASREKSDSNCGASSHRSSPLPPARDRQRYTPNGHYMRPTHASLVRRASSTSPLRAAAPTLAAPRKISPPAAQPRRDNTTPSSVTGHNRRLVVRSTHSSRLRAATTRPSQNVPAADGVSEASGHSADVCVEKSKGNTNSEGRLFTQRGRALHSTSRTTSRTNSDASVCEVYEEKARGGSVRSVDLYTSDGMDSAAVARTVSKASSLKGQLDVAQHQHHPSPRSAIPEKQPERSGEEGCTNYGAGASGEEQRQEQHSTIDGTAQRPRRSAPTHPQPPTSTEPSTASPAVSSSITKEDPGNAGSAEHRTVTVVLDSAEDDNGVCVTSPELQLFMERSQRKVRETERLLGRASEAVPRSSVASSPARLPSTANLNAFPEFLLRPPSDVGLSRAPPSSTRNDPTKGLETRFSSYLTAEKQHVSPPLSTTPPASTVRRDTQQQQQQRLQELRSRLKDYETPMTRERDAAVHLGESSSLSPLQQRPFWQHVGHYPAAVSLETSPMIQISPTSSDED